MLQARGDLRLTCVQVAGELVVLRLEHGVLLRKDGAFVLEIIEIVIAEPWRVLHSNNVVPHSRS